MIEPHSRKVGHEICNSSEALLAATTISCKNGMLQPTWGSRPPDTATFERFFPVFVIRRPNLVDDRVMKTVEEITVSKQDMEGGICVVLAGAPKETVEVRYMIRPRAVLIQPRRNEQPGVAQELSPSCRVVVMPSGIVLV